MGSGLDSLKTSSFGMALAGRATSPEKGHHQAL
jgi:hypothetical protein